MNLGKAIKKARGSYTQKEIARQTGVTHFYVSLLENNRKEPSLQWLKRFCVCVQKPLPELFMLADIIDKYGY